MVTRSFWLDKINQAWQQRSIIWLSGVRRAGKTFLCHSIGEVEYFDCELLSVRRQLEDPEAFLPTVAGETVVIDEIHHLNDPSNLLKIAADYHPDTRIIATGSSTLQASRKFRDTLTGRKSEIWLTPANTADMEAFGVTDHKTRLLRGGLPPFLTAAQALDVNLQEWIDSFWAKDIQELFRLEKRAGFLRLVELLMTDSGGIFEASRYGGLCEIDRQTVMNYLRVLESTWLMHLIKPFSSRSSNEIISAPKVYGFDTGFVSLYRGLDALRSDDLGSLWEHLVLNELHSSIGRDPVRYWRDKRGHEIDFVIARRGKPPLALECKWSYDSFETRNLKAFRSRYPDGDNILVAADIPARQTRQLDGYRVELVPLELLGEYLA